jgi:hypothetical protein
MGPFSKCHLSRNKNTITGKEGTENLIMSLPALVASNAAGYITIFWMMKT